MSDLGTDTGLSRKTTRATTIQCHKLGIELAPSSVSAVAEAEGELSLHTRFV